MWIVKQKSKSGVNWKREIHSYSETQKSKYPIDLTVIEDQGIRPILEKQTASPEAPGIQAIHLHEYALHLDKDKVCKWFVTVIPDPPL